MHRATQVKKTLKGKSAVFKNSATIKKPIGKKHRVYDFSTLGAEARMLAQARSKVIPVVEELFWKAKHMTVTLDTGAEFKEREGAVLAKSRHEKLLSCKLLPSGALEVQYLIPVRIPANMLGGSYSRAMRTLGFTVHKLPWSIEKMMYKRAATLKNAITFSTYKQKIPGGTLQMLDQYAAKYWHLLFSFTIPKGQLDRMFAGKNMTDTQRVSGLRKIAGKLPRQFPADYS